MNTITPSHEIHSHVPPAHRRRGLGFWIRRILLGIISSLIVLAAVGVLYQAVATAIDERTFAPPGRMIDVGGYQLHISCTGQGSPTVVLEAGGGVSSGVWAWVQPEVARQARVCTYDRAGIGWSERGPQPRDAGSVAQELHTLLQRAGESGPFVLAGHSLGGQYALMFAERYPEETAGLVLIDAQHPDTLFRIPAAQAIYRQQQQQTTMLATLSTNSHHDIVTGADHNALVALLSDSQRTVAAIRSVLALARRNKWISTRRTKQITTIS